MFFLVQGGFTPIFTDVSLSCQGSMGSPVLCSRLLFISAPAGRESPADQSLSAFSAFLAVSVWLVAFNISEASKLTLYTAAGMRKK